MHAAKVSRSSRLQRLIKLMADGRARTTREIVLGAECMAVSAAVSELRQRGAIFDVWRECVDGQPRWFYKMLKAPADA